MVPLLLMGALCGLVGLLVAGVTLWFSAGVVGALQRAHYGCSFTTGGDAVAGGEWVCTNNMVYVLPVLAVGFVITVVVAAALYVPITYRLIRRWREPVRAA